MHQGTKTRKSDVQTTQPKSCFAASVVVRGSVRAVVVVITVVVAVVVGDGVVVVAVVGVVVAVAVWCC